MRIGLLTSVGPMLDQFFPEIVREWEAAGHTVRTAAGDPAETLPGKEMVSSRNLWLSIANSLCIYHTQYCAGNQALFDIFLYRRGGPGADRQAAPCPPPGRLV